MKNIDTLVDDLYNMMSRGVKVSDEQATGFAHSLSNLIKDRLDPDERMKQHQGLRISNMGTPCDRKLWYQVNTPEDALEIPPNTLIKFLYGDLIEELFIFLCKLAGHRVEGEQEKVSVHGVPGHRDFILDGVQTDCKSANSRNFNKFKSHKLETEDPFGYLVQNDMYLEAGQDDPRVENKDEFAFLAIDKELGHVVVDKYPRRNVDYELEVERKKAMLAQERPPMRAFDPVPYQKSGNKQLHVACRYCPFKDKCWPRKRTFLYSTGPVELVEINKVPQVPEIRNAK